MVSDPVLYRFVLQSNAKIEPFDTVQADLFRLNIQSSKNFSSRTSKTLSCNYDEWFLRNMLCLLLERSTTQILS